MLTLALIRNINLTIIIYFNLFIINNDITYNKLQEQVVGVINEASSAHSWPTPGCMTLDD